MTTTMTKARLIRNNNCRRRRQGCWPSSSLCWWLTLLFQCVLGVGGEEQRLGHPPIPVSELTAAAQSGERIQRDLTEDGSDYELIKLVNSGDFIEINRYIDGSGMQRCSRNLIAADEDGDGKLTRTEYSEFVKLESNGTIDEDSFSALGASFISLYFAVACNQCYDNTQNETCCIGDAAYVGLPASEDDPMDQMLIFLCSSVEEAIAEATTPTPAPIASNPTRSPSLPNSQPSLVPNTKSPSGSTFAPSTRTTGGGASSTPTTGIPTTITTSTDSPTGNPTKEIPLTETPSSPSPVNGPTIMAIRIPTSSPTGSASSTGAPSIQPTSRTESPSPEPTSRTGPPSPGPTSVAPTPSPEPTTGTGVPSQGPTSTTGAPSSPQPASVPTSTAIPPTSSPTISTPAPTMSPSPEPTLVGPTTVSPTTSSPTSTVTTSTLAPTMPPSGSSTSITMSPTVQNNNGSDVLCVQFYFSIQNRVNLTAEDILLEVNNSLKTGLEAAAANVTIEILNVSFPRSDDSTSKSSSSLTAARQVASNIFRTFSVSSDNNNATSSSFELFQQPQLPQTAATPTSGGTILGQALAKRESHYTGRLERMVFEALSYELGNTSLTSDVLDTFLSTLYSIKVNDASHRLRTIGGGGGRHQRQLMSRSPWRRRRLVYYSDVLPPNVTNVVDDPFCPREDNMTDINCAIVSTEVCVFVEEGDDAQAIENALSDGFRDAVRNGTFFDAIPPEYLPQ